MATNEILPFAADNTGTNLLTQSEYTSDEQRSIGHQPGIARSKLANKAMRQASLLSSGLAEFIADYQGNNVTDSLTPQQVADYFLDALINTVMPAGTVIYVPQTVSPDGFLKSNGAEISRTTYSRLFSKIGTTFGVGNGSTTFNLPDLRGEFLRCLDDGRGVDAGRVLGSSQLDAFQGHWHEIPPNHTMVKTDVGTLTTGGPAFGSNNPQRGQENPITDGVNGTPRTGAETRPRNVSLLACIKF